MSIESLKQQARRHEQNEEWQKALDQYRRALDELARDDQVDIGLYNRVGDLYVRVGNYDAAFEHYDKSVDLYREAYLPNNAIAVCKKIIRNMPQRHIAYLRIGQLRAEQGFLSDARENFLTYAERMQQVGDIDESFRALIEFCDLAPDDVGVRVTVAENMAASGRKDEAVAQMLVARHHFAQRGEQGQADELEQKILALDPDADLTAVPAVVDAFAGSSMGDDGEIVAEFGEIAFGTAGVVEPDSEDVGATETSAVEPAQRDLEGVSAPASGAAGDGDGSDAGDFELAEAADELPMMAFGDDEDDTGGLAVPDVEDREEQASGLPMMELEDDATDDPELPVMAFDSEEEEGIAELPTVELEESGEELAELPMMDASDDERVEAAPHAARELEEAIEEAAERFVPELEPPAQPTAEEPPARPMPEPDAAPAPSESAPATSSSGAPEGGYIDLGAMILGGGEEKTTRLTVAYEEPSGDEEADFAKMLSQFKEKISENLDSSDVRAHYDLGTAYKEMGLLDEAISSFQAALRASANHLPTYELMGQTFIEMGKPQAAVKSLRRALQSNAGVEDDLVGIYYYLARAYEALDDKPSAVEFYDRVFSLDINFADVTERLRELR